MLKSAFRRWRERRRESRMRVLEKKVTAGEELRHLQRPSQTHGTYSG
jgi:hypothetical protein